MIFEIAKFGKFLEFSIMKMKNKFENNKMNSLYYSLIFFRIFPTILEIQ